MASFLPVTIIAVSHQAEWPGGQRGTFLTTVRYHLEGILETAVEPFEKL
jgi:hypothetical protein